MTAAAWLKRLEELMAAAEACNGEPMSLRDLVFGAYTLIEGGSAAVHAAFEDIPEVELAASAYDGAKELSSGAFTSPQHPATIVEGVRQAARLLRAAEAALLGLGSLRHGRLRPADFRAEFGGRGGWILPFPPRFRDSLEQARPYFARRGLARHRCLSESLPDGSLIDLRLIDASFGEPVVGAACLFEHLHLLNLDGEAVEEGQGPFIVTAIRDRDPAALRAAIETACLSPDKPDFVVFPELSLRPEDRAELQTLLQTTPWDEGLNGHRPALVFAGSWHDPIVEGAEVGRVRNCAPVYDGDGAAVGLHIKHAPYLSAGPVRDRLSENIVRGDRILVLASKSLTVAVAICLDYCRDVAPHPYDYIDADLTVIVSLGNDVTTNSHDRRSQSQWNSRKMGVFLSQQNDQASWGVCGARPGLQGFTEAAVGPVTIKKISKAG